MRAFRACYGFVIVSKPYMENDAQEFDSPQVHMAKKSSKITMSAMALALASMLFATAPAYADSTTDYNAKVAAAKAKISAIQAQLDTAKGQLEALQSSSNSDAQALAEAQSEVTLAKDALDEATSLYASASSAYDSAFSQQALAEDAYNDAVVATNNAIDALELAYGSYEQAANNSTTAESELNIAQANYDNSAITTGTPNATAGLQADIYTGISSLGNPPQRSISAYSFCKTITVTNINKDWGGGNIEGCGGDYIMIHYHGFITYPTSKQVYFYAAADDGFYLSINNQPIINDWSLKGCSGNSAGLFSFDANQSYAIDAWMYEWGGGACNTLYYQPLGSGQWSIAPASFFTQQPPAITTKDPSLKAILDQKLAAYVVAVAAEESALSAYLSAQDAYDVEFANLENKQQALAEKQSALELADSSIASAEGAWQTSSDVYADKSAILTNRKNKYAAVYAAIQAKAADVASLSEQLTTAQAELAAIPKPTTPPKTQKKVTSKPIAVTKVVARPKFVPIPKL